MIKKYGITASDLDFMLADHGDVCAGYRTDASRGGSTTGISRQPHEAVHVSDQAALTEAPSGSRYLYPKLSFLKSVTCHRGGQTWRLRIARFWNRDSRSVTASILPTTLDLEALRDPVCQVG